MAANVNEAITADFALGLANLSDGDAALWRRFGLLLETGFDGNRGWRTRERTGEPGQPTTEFRRVEDR